MSEQTPFCAGKQAYRLQFHAGRNGIAKVVEFFASDLNYAWELIQGDASHRDVDVWEDGKLVCQVSHAPERDGLLIGKRPTFSGQNILGPAIINAIGSLELRQPL